VLNVKLALFAYVLSQTSTWSTSFAQWLLWKKCIHG